MKHSIKLRFAVIIAASTIIASCGKYPDGPNLSLTSKTERVAGTWKIDQYYENGVDYTSEYRKRVVNESFVLEKDGKYTISATGPTSGCPINPHPGQTDTDSGTWEFIDKKEQFTMQTNLPNWPKKTYQILKLKKKEMWVKQVSTNGTTIELHFIQ